MKATFNIKVQIDSNNASTSFGAEKIEDMDTALLASVLKVFGDVSNRVKKDITDNTPANEETTDTAQEIPNAESQENEQ